MADFAASYPPSGGSGSGSVSTYPTFADFPSAATAGSGALALALDTDLLYVSNGVSWAVIGGPGVPVSIGAFDSGTPSANGAHIDGTALIMQSASATVPGLVNTTTQTLAGVKTLSSAPILSSLTASRAVVTDGSKALASSATTATEIGYVNGVTSAIQTQLDGKQSVLTFGSISTSTTGITVGSGANSTVGPNVTVDVQTASGSQPGLLSSADWTTFNNKQAALSIGTLDSGSPSANGAHIDGGNSLVMQSASDSVAGLVNTTTQEFGGLKIFDVPPQLPSLSPSLPLKLTAGGNITSAAINLSGGEVTSTLPVARGGTGLTAGTSGGILGYTASGTLASSSALTVSQLVIGGGAGATPTTLAAGTNTDVLTMVAGIPAWAAPATSGTVTSVAMTVPAFLSVSGSPVTSSGTLAVTLSGTALPIANGGTAGTTKTAAFDNLSPITTQGDLIVGGAAGTNVRLAPGSSTQVLHGGSNPAWGQVGLTSDVSGTLPISNGGTGQTTASAAFAALSPLGTKGDILVYSTLNTNLPVGSNNQVLTADSSQTTGLKWAAVATATLAQFAVDIGDNTNTRIATQTNLLGDINATARSAVSVTVSSGANAVVTWTSHGLVLADKVYFTAGTMPTGLTASTTYYVAYIDANSFSLSLTFADAIANTRITTSSTGTSVVGYSGGLKQITGSTSIASANATTATSRGQMQYLADKTGGANDIAYNNGNKATISISPTTPVINRAVLVPYQTVTGGWRCKFNIDYSFDSATTLDITVTQMTSFNAGNGQGFSGYAGAGTNVNCSTTANSDTMVVRAAASTTNARISGDIELNAKPNWAY